jgi:serine/threonine protein phosphatase 1
MKYYVTADTHGFFTLFREALEEKGFFRDEEDHKLILLGDLFDRGTEAKELQEFVLELMAKKQVILIRGNHEDLFETLVTTDEGVPYDEHLQNGTWAATSLRKGPRTRLPVPADTH